MNSSHKELLKLYDEIEKIKGVKRFYIGSGIRYDLFLNEKGFLDEQSLKKGKDGSLCRKYLERVILKHTSGRLKVAPEHTGERILKLMSKPGFSYFERLGKEFDRITQANNLRYQLVPYFISSHPGCTMDDMKKLSKNSNLKAGSIFMEQVQDFTPTPMTRSTAMFYCGMDTKFNSLYVEHSQNLKKKQKSFFTAGGKR